MYNLKLIIAFLILILSSCTQTFQKNGLSESKIKNFDLKIGKTSKKFLIDNYGPPIFENVFNDNVIYYISHSTSYKNFNEYEGVISLQTLSFIQDYKDVIKFLKNSHFKFFACSSLFWEGLIDFKIKVNELFDNSPSRKIKNFTYYNIYSLNNYINTMKSIGFKKNIVKKFIIKKPLQNKNKKKNGYLLLLKLDLTIMAI